MDVEGRNCIISMEKEMSLSKNEKLVVAITSLWALANTMSAVFVNVYLYAYTESLVVMTIFCIIRIALYPFFFTVAGKWAQRFKFSQPLTMGVLVTMLSLICVLTMNDYFAAEPNLVYVVAALIGIGESFFWLSVCSLHQIVASEESRPRYLGTIGIFNNIANVFAPMLSTLIIDRSLSDVDGYVMIFKLVLVVYAVMVVLAFRVKGDALQQSFSVLKCIRTKGNPRWRYCCITIFLYGMRDALILTLAGLLVYNATDGSGGLYSKLLTVFAIVAIVFYYYVSRKMNRLNMYRYYRIGAVLIASSTIILVVWPTVYGAIYYGIVNALASPLFANPWQMIIMGGINEAAKGENVIGRVIAKETYMALGRCLGMLCIVLCSFVLPADWYLPVSVIFCSLFPIWLVLYDSWYRRQEKRSVLQTE